MKSGRTLHSMKPVSSKRMIRIEKKKKKMAALLEISKLNEYDRAIKSSQNKKDIERDSTNSLEQEPSPKRQRTEISSDCSDIIAEEPIVPELSPSNASKLEEKNYLELKKLFREHSFKMRAQPNFRLRDVGENANLSVDTENRVPLFLSDVQHLLMYSQIGHHSPYTPARWCQLDKFPKLHHTNVLIIENVSLHHYEAHESAFPFLSSTFDHKLEVVTPGSYKADIVQELATVPLTGTQMRKFLNQFGTLEAAVMHCDEVFDLIKNLFPLNDPKPEPNLNCGRLPKGDKFSRTHLLLSGWQMIEENFPLPIKGLLEHKYSGYVLTKDSYKEVTPSSPMFGIDCEMCRTTCGDLELTRVSIVDENYKIFYEELVKPDNQIIDYLTRFSGITAKMMRNVQKKLPDVQKDIQNLLPCDAILVGQSLSNDLHALKMMHPYIIDTSVIYNITGDRTRKSKLQTLAREFLSERIQEGKGHCSIEDSLASLKLAKLKLENSLYFGDAVMANVQSLTKRLPNLGHPHYATSMLKQTTRMEKTALVVGLDDISTKYHYFTFKGLNAKEDRRKINTISEKCNKTVVQKMCENAMQYSLSIAHIKITNSQLERDNTKSYKKIDKWVREVYEHTASPGLCIVIFAGQQEVGNGVCFIQLKKNIS